MDGDIESVVSLFDAGRNTAKACMRRHGRQRLKISNAQGCQHSERVVLQSRLIAHRGEISSIRRDAPLAVLIARACIPSKASLCVSDVLQRRRSVVLSLI